MESMTPQERTYPFLMTVPSRCLRIAAGAGVEPSRVSGLCTQSRAMQRLLSDLNRGGWRVV
jgi:signal recognition particle GTPase